jgi:hypothetical protein
VPSKNVSLPGIERKKKEKNGKKRKRTQRGSREKNVNVGTVGTVGTIGTVGTEKGYFPFFLIEKKKNFAIRGHQKCYCVGTIDDKQ